MQGIVNYKLQENKNKKCKPENEDAVPWKDHRKTFKEIKVFRVKCAPVVGIAKRIVMVHNSRYLLAKHGYHHWFRWSVDPKNVK